MWDVKWRECRKGFQVECREGFHVGFHVGIQVGFQVECREGFQVGFRVVVDPAGGRPRGCGWLLVAAGMWQWTPRMWMVAGMWL